MDEGWRDMGGYLAGAKAGTKGSEGIVQDGVLEVCWLAER